jgi:hypothetical protein
VKQARNLLGVGAHASRQDVIDAHKRLITASTRQGGSEAWCMRPMAPATSSWPRWRGRGSAGVTHRLHPILREYDVRGVVGATLDAQDAKAIGLGLAAMFRAYGLVSDGLRPRVVVGRDGRVSSPMLEAALVEGLVLAAWTCCGLACRPRRCCILPKPQKKRW